MTCLEKKVKNLILRVCERLPPSLITAIRYFLYKCHKKPRMSFLLQSTISRKSVSGCFEAVITKLILPSADTPSGLTSSVSVNWMAKYTFWILWIRDLGSRSNFLPIFLLDNNSKNSINLIPSEKSVVMSLTFSWILSRTPLTQAVKAWLMCVKRVHRKTPRKKYAPNKNMHQTPFCRQLKQTTTINNKWALWWRVWWVVRAYLFLYNFPIVRHGDNLDKYNHSVSCGKRFNTKLELIQ